VRTESSGNRVLIRWNRVWWEQRRRRQYEVEEITSLKEGERAAFIQQYLQHDSKKLSEAQEHKIAKCGQTGI